MANEVNIYTPRYLAEVVRQAPPVHTFFRDTFFTNVKNFTTERVDIDLVKGDRRMAAFVHPRIGGKVLKASGYKTENYAPPLVNPYDVSTADRYMTRMPGEDLYSGMTPAQRSAQQLMEEYSRLNDATTRREEWMAVQAIVTGQIFKSITFDNGTEFAAAEELERSCINKHLPRTKVYFCHPYSSWERGTNENTNGMIRRRFPKGTNFAAVTNAQITQAENWINNYPRKILGYKSSEIVFRECLRELGIAA